MVIGKRILVSLVVLLSTHFGFGQVQSLELKQTIKGLKQGVISVAVAPQGDKLLVGYTQYAALFDLKSGKKLQTFKHEVDGSSSVNYVNFAPNGEFAVTVGITGKRKIWDVKSGKEETYLPKHKDWMPTPKFVKEKLGLKMTNSKFDTHYCQKNNMLEGTNVYGYAMKGGVIKFKDETTDRELKELKLVCEKNVLHYAPVYFFPDKKMFVTGNDIGEAFIYKY